MTLTVKLTADPCVIFQKIHPAPLTFDDDVRIEVFLLDFFLFCFALLFAFLSFFFFFSFAFLMSGLIKKKFRVVKEEELSG